MILLHKGITKVLISLRGLICACVVRKPPNRFSRVEAHMALILHSLPFRFLLPDGTLHIPDHFLPFGDGLRACPGESLADIELFIFFTHLLHQLNLKQDSEDSVPLEGDYQGYIITPRPFNIVVTPREIINDSDADSNTAPPEFRLIVDGPDM